MSTFKNSIFKKEIHIVSAVLVISALIYTVYAVNSRKTVAPQNLKAAACQANECSTTTGCQLPAFRLDGFKCVGGNQWEAPDGSVVPGGPDGPIPTPAAAAETNLQIAKKVLDWLDTQRDSTGAYISNGACKIGQEQSCDTTPNEDPTSFFSVVWARYQYFRKTNDQIELSRIIRDIDVFDNLYSQPENSNLRQSTQWMCKTLFEIGHDNSFIDQRSKIEYLCQNTWYAGAAMADVKSKVERNEAIPEPEIESAIQGSTVPYDTVIDPDRYLHGFYWYAVSASNLLSHYRWFNDNSMLLQAKLIYRKALQIYSNKKNDSKFLERGDAVIAVAALEFYKETNQKKYMDFVTSYINSRQNKPITNLSDAATYLFLLDEVYKETQDVQYQTLISSLIPNLVNDHYNSNLGAFREISTFFDRFDVRTNAYISSAILKY